MNQSEEIKSAEAILKEKLGVYYSNSARLDVPTIIDAIHEYHNQFKSECIPTHKVKEVAIELVRAQALNKTNADAYNALQFALDMLDKLFLTPPKVKDNENQRYK